MLCESIQPKAQYDSHKKKSMGSTSAYAIFMSNYHQKPFNAEGGLYKKLIEYDDIDFDNVSEIIAYVDPADKGKDYLCLIVAAMIKDKAYILDILFSDEDQDVTAPLVCEMITKHKVNKLRIESNDSLGFYRLLRDMLPSYHNNFTVLETFHQSKNKEARIKGNSGLVAEYIRFPFNWKYEHGVFYSALMSYQAKGKNAHDDAPDAVTGLLEMFMTDIDHYQGWTKENSFLNGFLK
jgi:predicted phage terminase large subunit-like protein